MHCCYDLILQNFFYMFQAMTFHHQKVSCKIQALRYNVISGIYGPVVLCYVQIYMVLVVRRMDPLS